MRTAAVAAALLLAGCSTAPNEPTASPPPSSATTSSVVTSSATTGDLYTRYGPLFKQATDSAPPSACAPAVVKSENCAALLIWIVNVAYAVEQAIESQPNPDHYAKATALIGEVKSAYDAYETCSGVDCLPHVTTILIGGGATLPVDLQLGDLGG
ncbi:hypothetical protein GCM10022243_48000 [Saccharothrix violaceirubra]|uniref:Lipoprotein n=1 Tax=Saccharothrix violaceirubra TaxID=413306 RepID=A0A7W7WUW0_9PSEU|nr:hypothetical protein [Saccharothrix violaceirubra]MBB4963858.1 hypothetical protein [Saccharothrix violaceirubra]